MVKPGKRVFRRRILAIALVIVAILVALAGTFRAFVIAGASDAPNLLVGDRVVVNRMAYDLFVPFTEVRLLSWSEPRRGDIVLCRFPGEGDGHPWLKRVVGIPGDTVELHGPRLIVNGEEMRYEILDRSAFADVPPENRIGETVAVESGAGMEHRVTFTTAMARGETLFGPARVAEDHYFVLGDSRDNSLDSRSLGLVSRDQILGRYAWTLLRAD
jgi:signal peptidase I